MGEQQLEPPVLVGSVVRLEPLALAHVDDLAAASGEDRSTYRFTSVPLGPAETRAYVGAMVANQKAGTHMPFAQVQLSQGCAVGCTAFATLRRRPDDDRLFAVEIGHTWLAAAAQRTGLNREAKLLLLRHAFEVWQVARVDFKTDARNDRSRAAIAGIGATFEGVLRNWQPSLVAGEESGFRDSAMFSVVQAQWPAVRTALEASLAR